MHSKPRGQMSESFLVAAILSASGGFQDAYTYIYRGQVFANAQTGNIVLLSQSIVEHNRALAIHYLVPLVCFALGVAIVEWIRQKYQGIRQLHWRQLVLLAEIFLLLFAGFFPTKWNLAANAVVSFACAMQVQAFRKVNGYSFASTMCIGNIRNGMESLCAYLRTNDKRILHKAFCYFGIIVMFALGAGFGGFLLPMTGRHTIWISCVLLLAGFSIMFLKEETEIIKTD